MTSQWIWMYMSFTVLVGYCIQRASGSVCAVSYWERWGACIGNCKFALRVRNRDVIRPPFPETSPEGRLVIRPCPPLFEVAICIPEKCIQRLRPGSFKIPADSVDSTEKTESSLVATTTTTTTTTNSTAPPPKSSAVPTTTLKPTRKPKLVVSDQWTHHEDSAGSTTPSLEPSTTLPTTLKPTTKPKLLIFDQLTHDEDSPILQRLRFRTAQLLAEKEQANTLLSESSANKVVQETKTGIEDAEKVAVPKFPVRWGQPFSFVQRKQELPAGHQEFFPATEAVVENQFSWGQGHRFPLSRLHSQLQSEPAPSLYVQKAVSRNIQDARSGQFSQLRVEPPNGDKEIFEPNQQSLSSLAAGSPKPKPCGTEFGKERCCRPAPRQLCPDGSFPQRVLRWSRSAENEECIPYTYSYCGASLEREEGAIKYEQDCYESCFTQTERMSNGLFRKIRFHDGFRIE